MCEGVVIRDYRRIGWIVDREAVAVWVRVFGFHFAWTVVRAPMDYLEYEARFGRGES